LLIDEINIRDKSKFKKLLIGGEFFVRYVPQSRYFQSQELEISESILDNNELKKLNQTGSNKIEKIIYFS